MIKIFLCETENNYVWYRVLKISHLTTEELIKQLPALNVFKSNFDAHVKINGFRVKALCFSIYIQQCIKKSYPRKVSLVSVVKCHATR